MNPESLRDKTREIRPGEIKNWSQPKTLCAISSRRTSTCSNGNPGKELENHMLTTKGVMLDEKSLHRLLIACKKLQINFKIDLSETIAIYGPINK